MIKFNGPGALGREQDPFPFYYIKRSIFGPCLDLPNRAAQNQNTYGSLSPTYRRSQHAIMKTRLKTHWHKVVVVVKRPLLKKLLFVFNAVFVSFDLKKHV